MSSTYSSTYKLLVSGYKSRWKIAEQNETSHSDTEAIWDNPPLPTSYPLHNQNNDVYFDSAFPEAKEITFCFVVPPPSGVVSIIQCWMKWRKGQGRNNNSLFNAVQY